MVIQTILIPGTDFELACLELDIEDKTAIIGVKHNGKYFDFVKSDVPEGAFLRYFSSFGVFVERVTNESLQVAIWKKTDEFHIENGDTNALGYSNADIDNLFPGRVLLIGGEIELAKGERTQLENTYFYLGWGEDGLLKLWYRDTVDKDRFKPFNPQGLENRFIVHEELTKVSWIEGSSEKGGVLFDATGSGDIDSESDYSVYNEFYIKSVTDDSITVNPILSLDVVKNNIVKIRGQKYLIADRQNNQISGMPVDRKILPAYIRNNKYTKFPEVIIHELADSIGNNTKTINTQFRSKHNIKKDLIRYEPLNLIKLIGCCKYEKDFTDKILHLTNIIDGIKIDCFKEVLANQPKHNGSINYLEQYLKENRPDYNVKIIRNLKNLKILRSKKFGVHGKEDPKLKKALDEMGLPYPILDWNQQWIESLRLLDESLTKFSKILAS